MSDPEGARSTTPAIAGERCVTDATGELWRVYELSGATYDRRSSLVFESEHVVRRLRNYPRDWRSLGNEELLRLSWNA